MIDNNIKNILNTLCKVSMCDPQESTDLNYIDKMNRYSEAEKFIIEFGTLKPTIKVSVGQHIKLDDTIAEMNGIPVKSKINGTITEITNRYIVGVYDTDVDAILSAYGLNESLTQSDLLKQFNIQI